MAIVDPLTASAGTSTVAESPAYRPVLVAVPQSPRLTVLAPKLHAPRLPPESVRRERLLEILNRGTERKVTILSAPAGYGKSTLLTQ